MKKITTILLILITSITISHAQKFKLTGQIIGAEKGDTLRFDNVNTRWQIEPDGFDVIIGKNGKIKYRGKQEHSQYYGVTYYPVNGEKTYCDRRWLDVFITDGTIKITGTREYIYYSSLEGGVYDDELNKIRFIKDSLGKVRGDYFKLRTIARINKDTLEMKRSQDLINNFGSDKKERAMSTKAKELKAAYDKNNPNEYLACEIAMQGSDTPIKELKESYEKFSTEVQGSYYGRQIKQTIETLEARKTRELGQPVPNFKLISTKGNTVTLDMLKGKYLLIYHFGMCPGSMQIDKHVVNLYNKYKDKLNVISYTSSLRSIQEHYKTANDGDKEALNSMLNHPWEHVFEYESIPNNALLNERYEITGLPYFIFISPESKMIRRGYFDVNEVNNILKNL